MYVARSPHGIFLLFLSACSRAASSCQILYHNSPDRITSTVSQGTVPPALHELLDAAHQRHHAVLLLVVREDCPVRNATDQVIAPVLLYKSGFPHAGIIEKTATLSTLPYQSAPPPTLQSHHIGHIAKGRPLSDT